jgi:stress response protein YsnF
LSSRPEPYETGHRDAELRSVPHGAEVTHSEDGWHVTVPLRQEHVAVRRATVAVREISVSTGLAEDIALFRASVRREDLTLEENSSSR